MGTLYLIRHGQASFGEENYDRLSDLGRSQAEILAEYLVAVQTRFDAIYTGTLERHLQTAEPFVKTLEERIERPVAKHVPGLNEYQAEAVMRSLIPIMVHENPAMKRDVDRMMRSNASFQKVFAAVMTRWVAGNDSISDNPSWREFVKTVFEAVQRIVKTHGRNRTVAVFTSGGPISAVTGRVLRLSDMQTMELSWQIMNASITRFRFGPDRMSLSTFNEIGHLEIKGNEFLTYR